MIKNNNDSFNKKKKLGRGIGILLGEQGIRSSLEELVQGPSSSHQLKEKNYNPKDGHMNLQTTAHVNTQLNIPTSRQEYSYEKTDSNKEVYLNSISSKLVDNEANTKQKISNLATKQKDSDSDAMSIQMNTQFVNTQDMSIHSMNIQNKIWHIPIEKIKPSPYQPRQTFNQEEIEELAQSIREKGVIQPIIVRKQDEDFELIAGERRWRAAQLAGIYEIPALIKEYGDLESLEIAIIENIQRANLDPIEEALAYQRLSTQFDLTQADIAKKVGKDRASIANLLRLLQLPVEIQDLIRHNKISVGHAKVLLGIEDLETQKAFTDLIVQKSLSVRALENLIKKQKNHKLKTNIQAHENFALTLSAFQALESKLSQRFGNKVKIQWESKEKGKLMVWFDSVEQLNEILFKMGES